MPTGPIDQTDLFNEVHEPSLLQEAGPKGNVWDVVLIRPGLSKNGTFYPPEVLRKAVPLFEGIRACAYRYGSPLGDEQYNHLPDRASLERPGGFVENVVGWFENVRYGTFKERDGKEGEGIIARFHIMDGAEWLCKNLRDAWQHAKEGLLGFSIDARGVARDDRIDGKAVKRVERIDEVKSTDVVTNPAAGGSVLRLVAAVLHEQTNLGDFIRRTAEEKEISTAQLASAAGISESTMSDIITGRIMRPPDRRLRGIARVLGVSLDRLRNLIPAEIRESGLCEADVFGGDLIYDMIATHRPAWVEGFATPTVEQDMDEYCTWILEAVLVQGEEIQRNIPVVEVKHLAEVARGVNTINAAIKFIREKKVQEAIRLLRDWILVHPMREQGTEASKSRGLVSFPYSAKPVNASEGERKMPDDQTPNAPELDAETQTKLKKLAELEAKEKETADREAAVALREREALVDERLKDSALPENARVRVREQLLAQEGELTAEAIDALISKEQAYIDSFKEETLPAGQPVGLGNAHGDITPRVAVGMEKQDRWAKSWEGFFNNGIPVDGVPAFSSLHETLGIITGKYFSKYDTADILMECLYLALPHRPLWDDISAHTNMLREAWNNPQYVPASMKLREAIGTGDFSVSFGDSINLKLQKEYRDDPRNDWRQIISRIENLSDLTNKFNFVRIGGVGVLPTVTEKAPYQELTDPTEVNEQLTPFKKGGLLKLTWEDMLADRIGVVRSIPGKLAGASVRTIHELVWDEIDLNPNLADSNALISAANANRLSGDGALSYANVTTLIQQLRNQTEQDSGKKLGLAPAFILVGPTKENEAVEITDSSVKVNANEDATVRSFINRIGVKTFATLGLGRSTSPDTQFRYYVAASPRDAETIAVGFLGGRDRPDIFVQSPQQTPTAGQAFTADTLTFKVRLGVGAKVLDHRWIQGSLATS